MFPFQISKGANGGDIFEHRSRYLILKVLTIAISIDDNKEYMDPDFVDWAADINSKKALANIFQDKPTSFSSCCFHGDETILVKNKKGEKELISLKDFVELFDKNESKIEKEYKIISINPKTLREEEVSIIGILKKKNSSNKLIEININGKVIKVTPDHEFLVKDLYDNKIKKISAIELLKNKNRYLIPIED